MSCERDRFGWGLQPLLLPAPALLSARCSLSQISRFEAKSAEFSMPSSYGLATVIH